MKLAKQILLTVVTATASNSADAAPKIDASSADSKILIKMINSSTLSPKALAKGADVAQDIFADSGVGTEWIDCTAAEGERADDPRCGARVTPLVIYLRVLPRKQSKRLGLPKAALGVALIPADDFGLIANVFSHRVEEIHRWTGADSVTVLAHILAHEVGHLLLHQPEHSAKGLMQAAWKEKQLQNAMREKLHFTPVPTVYFIGTKKVEFPKTIRLIEQRSIAVQMRIR